MKQKSEIFLLMLIITISTAIVSSVAFISPSLKNDGSHFILRNAENIKENGIPLYNDQLSYGGRTNMFNPGTPFLIAGLLTIFPKSVALYIIPVLIASTISIAIYFITKKLTKKNTIAFFTSIMSVSLPVYIQNTANSINTIFITIPLMFFAIFYFINIGEGKKNIYPFLITIIGLALITPHILILGLILITYAILLRTTNIVIEQNQKEAIIFTVFFAIWSQFLIYKNALTIHGPAIIWQNIPLEILQNFFTDLELVAIITYIGIVPLVCGVYALYKYTFISRDPKLYMIIASTGVITALLLLRLLPLEIGLIYLGLLLTICTGLFIVKSTEFIKETKYKQYHKLSGILIMSIFAITTGSSTIIALQEKPFIDNTKLETYAWIKENIPENSTLLTTLEEGHSLTYYTNRKNIIDTHFLGIHDINERANDIRIMYISPSIVKALQLLNFYEVDFILMDYAYQKYNVDRLRYADTECVVPIYTKEEPRRITIFEVKCIVSSERN